MRRLLIVACSSLGLVACASILGDFDVEPAGTSTPDGSLSDASNDALGPDGSNPTGEAGVDAGPVGIPSVVAVNQFATCANVDLAGADTSYCWGASNPNVPAYLGVLPADPRVNGVFARPHVLASTTPLTFGNVLGSNSGSWFLATAAEGQPQGGALLDGYAWGANSSSQTGVPSNAGADELPHLLREGGNAVAPLKPTAGAAGQTHGCVIDSGNLYCWGANNSCEVTGGATQVECQTTNPTVKTPRKFTGLSGVVFDQVAVGLNHTCVITHQSGGGAAQSQKGTIYCWGGNGLEEAGQPPPGIVTSPKQPENLVLNNVTVAQLDIAAGDNHTCARVKTDVYCWGRNIDNQVSPGAGGNSQAPTKLPIPGAAIVTSVAVGGTISCAVTATVAVPPVTSLNCFGSGPLLARSDANASKAIAPVDGLTGIKSISIGKNHACAVGHLDSEPAGTPQRVLCWGSNQSLGVDPTLPPATSQAGPHPVPLP